MVGGVSQEVGSVDGGQAWTTAVVIKAVVIIMSMDSLGMIGRPWYHYSPRYLAGINLTVLRGRHDIWIRCAMERKNQARQERGKRDVGPRDVSGLRHTYLIRSSD